MKVRLLRSSASQSIWGFLVFHLAISSSAICWPVARLMGALAGTVVVVWLSQSLTSVPPPPLAGVAEAAVPAGGGLVAQAAAASSRNASLVGGMGPLLWASRLSNVSSSRRWVW